MKSFMLFSLIIFWNFAHSQTFLTSIFFEDASGNRDTIEIGIDPNSSDSINPLFDGPNLVDSFRRENLDVRIASNLYNDIGVVDTLVRWETKRKVLGRTCEPLSADADLKVEIKTDKWPVKVMWDSSFFFDSCIDGSIITDWPPGHRYDAPVGVEEMLGPAYYLLKNRNEFSFENIYEIPMLSSIGDTIKVIYFALGKFVTASSQHVLEESFEFDAISTIVPGN